MFFYEKNRVKRSTALHYVTLCKAVKRYIRICYTMMYCTMQYSESMPRKHPITVYIESSLYERIKKAKQLREKKIPPGWPKISSYTAHLIEEGLKTEELFLDDVQKNEHKQKVE